jgi:hypothetical protein
MKLRHDTTLALIGCYMALQRSPLFVYEHSFDEKVYDANPITGAGRNRNQETFEMDMIFHY